MNSILKAIGLWIKSYFLSTVYLLDIHSLEILADDIDREMKQTLEKLKKMTKTAEKNESGLS